MTVAQASHGRAGRAWPGRHVAAAAGFGLAALVVWLLAYGTDRGLRFDLEAAHGLDTPGYDIDFFLFSVRIVVPLTFVAIAAAALLGRRRHALAAAAILVGTSASCVVLKTVLGRLDPLHGDAARGIGEFFPSVHTGAAAGAALGLTVLAVGGLRLPTAFAAAAYIAAVGTASIVAGGHFPSDVAGALLVAAAWGSLAAGMLALGGGAGDGGNERAAAPRRGRGGSGGRFLSSPSSSTAAGQGRTPRRWRRSPRSRCSLRVWLAALLDALRSAEEGEMTRSVRAALFVAAYVAVLAAISARRVRSCRRRRRRRCPSPTASTSRSATRTRVRGLQRRHGRSARAAAAAASTWERTSASSTCRCARRPPAESSSLVSTEGGTVSS